MSHKFSDGIFFLPSVRGGMPVGCPLFSVVCVKDQKRKKNEE